MKRTLSALVASTCFALLTGCQSEPADHGAYLPVNVTVNDLENHTALVLLDQRVQDAVTCPGIQETRLSDNRLQVAVHLRNRGNHRLRVQANCEFKDAQGFVTDSTQFQNVFLDENAQEDVKFVSMDEKVVRYTVRVRRAR
jgi:hypothetical protein